MKKTLFLVIFILNIFLLNAQDNEDRARTMISMAMTKATNGSSIDEINELFNNIVDIHPDFHETYTAWGTCIIICDEVNYEAYEDAFHKFRKATKIKPDNAMAYYLWGAGLSIYADHKKDRLLTQEAFLLYQKAIDINPQFVELYMTWGIRLLECAKTDNSVQYYKEAIDKFEKAIEITPEDPDAWECKAWAYFRISKLENNFSKYKKQMIDSFIEADRIGVKTSAYNLACYYSLTKEKEDALKWFEKMLIKRGDEGIDLKNKIIEDEDFNNIRNEKKYKELMKRFFQD